MLPLDLPIFPRLRFLTLKASVGELHVPHATLSIMATLPSVIPELEAVTVVICAEYEDRKDDDHHLDVDKALQSMPCLREMHFILSISRPSEHAQFNDCIRQKLPLASEAGLLSWSTCSWHKLRHPMASFSFDIFLYNWFVNICCDPRPEMSFCTCIKNYGDRLARLPFTTTHIAAIPTKHCQINSSLTIPVRTGHAVLVTNMFANLHQWPTPSRSH
jgi:hypothetical protein